MAKLILRWALYFVPALAVELICYLTSPLVAFFVHKEPREDTVKRLNRQVVTMDREYLVPLFYLWQTHDNAVDEWWYGMYNTTHWFEFARNWTQEDYDKSWWVRYYCRVMWLWRNCAYGWHYFLFSRPLEENGTKLTKGVKKSFWYELNIFSKSFQLELHLPVGPKYISINIGWKPHKGKPKLLYANRIFSLKSRN